ncbi:hypothetical protein C3B44_00560 [Corynebacterium yudongzhengii]|uniref:Uncharacterized protein n=1 Tax=Corynebacterium yudongzhengii TaxID=2080740 RepID=A0A2U1T5H8_9CORY|nr:hypothetical protein [Corynebacterium yudongzhengii]AWB81025.1 hypothetical protein C3B44_00560 [Corynebacterium yudongzhengii]PWC01270.1 hypothetical protein DF222_08220 [Corynebacterium yudongzhengii]
MEQRAQDSYSLDDTELGRISQALGVAACVAVPDYVSGRWPVIGARIAALGAGLGIAAAANAAEEPADDEPEADEAASPVTTWTVIGAAAAALAGLSAVEGVVAKHLRGRGVKRPHTLLGALAGAVVYVGSEVEHRRHQGDAS